MVRHGAQIYENGGFDVLFPTQEQVAVLSAVPPSVVTAVPTFEALSRVQDENFRLCHPRLSRPSPTPLGRGAQTWRPGGLERLPGYLQAPIGTASNGIRQISSRDELSWEGDPFLVQERVEGPLAMAQSVFDRGRLVASAADLRMRKGAGGGASHKRSVDLPLVRTHLARLGQHLKWHGALSADVILGADGPLFIDINPRLVEPGNARLAGVDLVDAVLNVALGQTPVPRPVGRVGVATHQLLLAAAGRGPITPHATRSASRAVRGGGPPGELRGERRRAHAGPPRPTRRPSRDRGGPHHPGLATVLALLLFRRRRELHAEPWWLEDHRVHPNRSALAARTAYPCRYELSLVAARGTQFGTLRIVLGSQRSSARCPAILL